MAKQCSPQIFRSRMGLVEEKGPTDQSYQMQLSHNSGTTIPVSKLVKGLGVQTDNIFSPFTQCSFPDLSKSASIPLYGALLRPHLKYGLPACSPNLVADINHLERIQRLATRLVTGMRHLPYEGRLQRLGRHSLQRRRLQADLITAFKIFTGLLDIDPNLLFIPPTRRGLRGHPYKVLQRASHRRRRGSAFSVRVVNYWNKLPASVVTAPCVKVFKKRL